VGQSLVGRSVVAGSTEGRAVVSHEPLSFWGGFEPETGEIIDRRHERSGEVITGKIFVFPFYKGSSTGSRSLLEAIRAGTAPAGIVNLKVDPILALGSILGGEFYDKIVPIVTLAEDDFCSIADGEQLVIEPDGTVRREDE